MKLRVGKHISSCKKLRAKLKGDNFDVPIVAGTVDMSWKYDPLTELDDPHEIDANGSKLAFSAKDRTSGPKRR
jgi:hypothetical protein